MDRLSSCYFCGDALDASLDEYPVVPREFSPTSETQQTVVLCGGCRRKLDSVLEVVVEAAESAESGAANIESSLDGGEDVLRSVTDADRVAEGGVSEHGSDDATDDDETDGSDRSDTVGDDSRDRSGNPLDVSQNADEPGGEGGEPSGRTDESGGETTETTLTKLEYNKVMRLLQNREFPVDRDGFVTVAANAYELSHPECEQVIDVAIQHDLIDERDGQLVKPDDGDS